MNYKIYESQMPKLSINDEELKKVVFNAISNFSSSGFQFINLTNNIGATICSERIGLSGNEFTTYEPKLDRADIARIREIIWDYIILRYVTIGNYYHDEWPHLSLTESGVAYFSQKT